MNTCYIFAAGNGFPKAFSPDKNDIVIAADAGIKNLSVFGVSPDIAVGDFDSLGYVPNNCETIRHPVMKDDTDTMLALKTGLERGFRRFVIYGGTGGRPDHTLANYQTLCFASVNGAQAYLCGDDYCACAVTNGRITFKSLASGSISVFAFCPCNGVTLKGLTYPLENSDLSPFFPLGVSNSFNGKSSTIEVKNGTLVVIWQGCANDVESLKSQSEPPKNI